MGQVVGKRGCRDVALCSATNQRNERSARCAPRADRQHQMTPMLRAGTAHENPTHGLVRTVGSSWLLLCS